MTKKVLYTNFEGIDDTIAAMKEEVNDKEKNSMLSYWAVCYGKESMSEEDLKKMIFGAAKN